MIDCPLTCVPVGSTLNATHHRRSVIYRILLPDERRQLGTASFTLSELDAALVNGSF